MMTGSDEEGSGSRSDRPSRFSDIATEFTDELGVESEDDPGVESEDDPGVESEDDPGVESEDDPDTRHESGSLDTDDGASGPVSTPDSGTDRWEWIGDDESGDETGRDRTEPGASDAPKRSGGGGRLWNDGPTDDEPTDNEPTDNEPTDNEPTDNEPADNEPADNEPADNEPTDNEPADNEPTDNEPADNEPADNEPADEESVEDVPTDDPSWDDTGGTGTDAAGAGPEPSPDDRSGGTSGRIWDESTATPESSTVTETTRSPPDGGVSAESSPTDTSEALDASGLADDESALDGRRLDPGTNVLIQSESRSDRTSDGCRELLFGREGTLDPYVLLIRYQPMDGERLEDIASNGHRTHVVSVGYAQSVPPAVDGTVEVTQINNPNDITRLGIIVSRITEGWSTDDREIRVCYDSLNVLLNYRDVKNAFRFLHVFLSMFTKTDAVAHFHADPLEGDPQAINTVKPLFDEVVSMDSTGTYVE